MSSKIQFILKRFTDVLLSLISLVILAMPFGLIALAIKLSSKGAVFFRQERVGLHGRCFTIYKFRTMMDERDGNGKLLPDGERLTSLGRFLRKISMDELPECFNVLKGDMSIVGPRPLPMRYLDRYTPEQARRHEVKPGITGWALIHGRNALTWEEKFDYDIYYVENHNSWLDMKIILLTIVKVILAKDVSRSDQETMPEFTGTKNYTDWKDT